MIFLLGAVHWAPCLIWVRCQFPASAFPVAESPWAFTVSYWPCPRGVIMLLLLHLQPSWHCWTTSPPIQFPYQVVSSYPRSSISASSHMELLSIRLPNLCLYCSGSVQFDGELWRVSREFSVITSQWCVPWQYKSTQLFHRIKAGVKVDATESGEPLNEPDQMRCTLMNARLWRPNIHSPSSFFLL